MNDERIQSKQLGVIHYAMAGLMIISVGRIHMYVPAIAVLRPGLVLFAFCVLYVALSPKSVELGNIKKEWPTRMIMAFLGVYVLSSLTGISLGSSVTFFLDNFGRVLTFFFLLVAAVRRVNDLRFFVYMYVLSLLFIVWVTFFLGETADFGSYTRVTGTATYDGNDLGVLYMVGLPFAVVMIRSGARLSRLIGIVAIIGIPGSIALTASRGAFLGLVSCLMGLLFLSPGLTTGRRIGIAGAVAVAMLVFAPTGYWGQISTIGDADDYNVTSETGRLAIWERGMGYVAERPLLGVGPNNFIRAAWGLPQARFGFRDQAAHNTFVQIWAETGTVGLLIILSVILGGSHSLLRLRSRLPRGWLRGTADQRFLYLMVCYLPVSFLGFSVSAFFVTHGYTPMLYIMTAFLSTLLLLVRQEVRRSQPKRSGVKTASGPSGRQ